MKKLCTALMLMVLISANAFCQPPQAFKYQAVVRNSSGDIIANQAVGIQINIRNGLALGQIVYQETHAVSTNEFGLVNLEIGKGIPNVTMATFDDINWGLNSKYLEILVDPSGGTNYVSIGTSELQSVPYSLFSKRAANSPWESNSPNIYFNTGNIGIGTTDPQYRLDVWAPGTTSTGIGVFRNSLGENKIVLRQNSNGCGAINVNNAANAATISLVGEGNSYFNSGNLGIGTTSPDIPLVVKSSGAGDVMKILSNTDNYLAKFRQTGNNSGALYLYDGLNNATVFLYGDGNSFINSGSLGLGTSSPVNAKLQIEGTGTYDAILRLNNMGTNGASFFMGTTNSDWGGGVNENLFVMGHGAPASGAIDLSINSSGYLGIGTPLPLAGLHLKGSDWPASFLYIESAAGNNAGLRIYEGATAKWHIFNNAALGGLHIYNTAGQTVFFANQSGNVGIGTTSPTSRLDVRGNVTIRDNSTGAIAVELGTGLDYAEGFNVSDKTNIDPGTVLCIDSENPGNLKISSEVL